MMKKFKLESVKQQPKEPVKPAGKAKSSLASKIEQENERKKKQLEKEMAMLTGKIGQTNAHIAQTEKQLDIDTFLQKQKQKRKDYAKNLNSQFERQKREREQKLYKTSAKQGGQRLSNTVKSEVPLGIFGAVEQARQVSSVVRKWVLNHHHYALDEMAIDKSKSELFGEPLRQAEEKCLKINSQNKWIRAREVSDDCSKVRYFPVSIRENQLEPSDSGQALMAALTLLPSGLSEHIHRQYKGTDGDEYFMLRFWPGGDTKSILTDQRIEVRQYLHKQVNVGSRCKDGVSFWSTIAQKAYRKLYHEQIMPVGLPQTVHSVTGIDPQIIPFNNKVTIRNNWYPILSALTKHQPHAVIAFIDDSSPTPLRCYPLKEIEVPQPPKSKKKSKIKEEHPQSMQPLYCVSNPYSGTVLKSDFINKFTLNQLYAKFNRLIVLRDYPARWAGVRIRVEFLSNGPVSLTGSQWTKNNQYSFTVARNTSTRIFLRRKWGTVIPQDSKDSSFGFVLFRSPDGSSEVTCMKLENLVGRFSSNDLHGSSFTGDLKKGTYVLLPFTTHLSQQYLQCFNLDILAAKEDIITVNRAKIHEYSYQNAFMNTQKVVQKLNSKVRYEKPRYQKFDIPKIMLNKSDAPSIDVKALESLGLSLSGVELKDYFVPGKLKGFLVQGQLVQSKKEVSIKKNAQTEQIQKYEKQEALRVLLGYDALLGEEISHGQVMSLVDETSDELDLAHFQLGQEGLLGIIESMMQYPRLTRINLAHNNLNDSAVTYLCYYLQKSNRGQLKQLNLTSNNITATGVKAIRGLRNVFPGLQIVGCKIQ